METTFQNCEGCASVKREPVAGSLFWEVIWVSLFEKASLGKENRCTSHWKDPPVECAAGRYPVSNSPRPAGKISVQVILFSDIKVFLLWQGHWFKIESTTSGPESGRACWVQEQPASWRVSNLSLAIASWAHCFPSQGTAAWWFFLNLFFSFKPRSEKRGIMTLWQQRTLPQSYRL